MDRKLILVLLLGLMLSGCQKEDRYGPRGRVTGKVTYEGQPVSEGAVSFFNAESSITTSGKLEADGSYTLMFAGSQDVPLGKYIVTVHPPSVSHEPGEAPPPQKEYPDIPFKYRERQTTDLTAEVEAKDQEFDFELGG